MKLLSNITSILAIISLLSTLICGLWIRSQDTVDPSSTTFHMVIGVITVVLCILAIILLSFGTRH